MEGYSPMFGGNQWKFEATITRSGNNIIVKDVYVTPKWKVNSLEKGWTFTVWVKGNPIKNDVKKKWTTGTTVGEGWAGRTRLDLDCTAYAVASEEAWVTIGVDEMSYNGVTYKHLTTTFEFGVSSIIPKTPALELIFNDSKYFAYNKIKVYRYQDPTIKVTDNGNGVYTKYELQYKNLKDYNPAGDTSSWYTYSIANAGTFQKGNINQMIPFNDEFVGRICRVRASAKSSTDDVSSNTDWKYFIFNDIPVMDNKSIKVDKTITIDPITLTWNAATDIASTKKAYIIDVENQTTKKVETKTVGDVKTYTLNLSSVGIEKGQKALIKIYPADDLSRSYVNYGNLYVTRNSAPKFSTGAKITTDVDGAPYNKYFLNSVKLTIPTAIDAEKQTVKYRTYYRKREKGKEWSNWAGIDSLSTEKTRTVTPTINKGEEIQFGVVAHDGLEYNQAVTSNTDLLVMSQVLTKAVNPNSVSTITILPALDTNTIHYETIKSINWTAATACNGTKVTDYEVTVEVKQTRTATEILYQGTKKISNALTVGWDITTANFSRGYYFRFKIIAIDMYGLKSNAAYTQWFRRNQIPNSVPQGSFKVNSNKTNFYKTVPLKWNKATDPDGDPITYAIYFSKNKESYVKLVSGLKDLNYIHNIENLPAGTILGYKIVAFDKFGISSPGTVIEKSNSLVVNTAPNPPQIFYPISKIYDKQPRILFKTKGDKNNDTLNIVVTFNGENYNSATSPSMFNKTIFKATDDYGVFIPPALKEGVNTLKFRTFDGYQYSTEVVYKIEYVTPTLNKLTSDSEVVISKSIIDKMKNMITDTRKAYGKTAYSYDSLTANETIITASTFNKLYNSILEINTMINTTYTGLNRIKTKPTIAKDNLISKNVYNSIFDLITNI